MEGIAPQRHYPGSRIIDEALTLGWSIIPCGKDKKPRIKSWKQFQIRCASPNEIAAWERELRPACCAVVTGAVSNLIVLDFGGEAGKRLAERLGLTANIRTGSGGFHVYADYPGHLVRTRNTKTSQELGLRYPGLDIRADGGYAIFTGENQFGKYEQLRPLAAHCSLDSLPTDLKLLLGLVDQPAGAQVIHADPSAHELIRQALQRALSEGRNDAGFWLACQLRDSGYSEQEARRLGAIYVQQTPEISTKGQLEPYTPSEYFASVRQAFTRKARGSPVAASAGDLNSSPKEMAEPSAYELRPDGVYWRKPARDGGFSLVWLSSPVKVLARTRDHQGFSWGLLLEWSDAEGRIRTWVMPMSLLSSDGSEIGRHLRDGGLPYLTTNPQWRMRFLDYLQLANPDKYVRSTARTGWHGDVFVLPDRTIGKTDGSSEEVFFQADADYRDCLKTAGTLEGWRAGVGSKCSGNSRLVLAVSTAFAGPILGLVGAESGGVHLFNASSIGKTTALMVAGSVLGGGGERGFIQSWRTTNNGVELLAEHHNHLTLLLDEISQSQAEEAAEIVYTLANEQGKQHMARGLKMMRTTRWKLLFLSSGEITLANHIQLGGRRSRGGVEVRLLNLEADAGVGLGLFEDLHGLDEPSKFADHLKTEAGRNYGTPIRKFLEHAVLEMGDIRDDLARYETEFKRKVLPQNASGEMVRAASRFSLVAFAGKKQLTGASRVGNRKRPRMLQ